MKGGETQSDRVFGAVRADILGCRLLPSAKLRINELAAQNDVSLGAVREALSRLAAEGLVVAESQKGFRVAPLSVDDFRDLTDARIEIEKLTLARSIERGDVEWESQLVAAWHRLSRTSEYSSAHPRLNSDEWSSAHREYHRALVAACGSEKLLNIRAQLYEQAERYRRYSGIASEKQRDVAGEHERLFKATIARDAPAALREMGEHLSLTADIIIASATLEPSLDAAPDPSEPSARKRARIPAE